MSAAITDQLRALERMGLNELRDQWRRRYGSPPTLRAVDLLRRLLAWRIQVDAHGGLDAATVRLLTAERDGPPPVRLAAGTRLAREWRGVRHEVDVTVTGFRYGERDYRSLSEIAREISGSRWNGLRFFGLRGPRA